MLPPVGNSDGLINIGSEWLACSEIVKGLVDQAEVGCKWGFGGWVDVIKHAL